MPRGLSVALFSLLLLIPALLLVAVPAAAQDTDGDGLEDAEEATLLDQYAPILHFHPDEQYFPTSVQFALDTSELQRYNDSGPPILIEANPTPAVLANFSTPADPEVNPGDVYFLNSTLGGRRDHSGILAAYEVGAYPQVVYGRATVDAGQTILQYWFYYAFNPGVYNNHEGDWEMIQVMLSAGSPMQVAYAQHHSGERMPWTGSGFLPDAVLLEGTHPKVFVALGAHASYLRPYQGHLGVAGDTVSDQGAIWTNAEYSIVNVGELSSPTAGNEWLQFAGRWGEFSVAAHARAEAGPPGPGFRANGAMFGTPVAWASELTVPSVFNLGLQWFLANLWTIFLVLLGISLLVTIIRIIRVQRRTKVGVRMWPFAHLLPFDRKSAAMVLAVVGLALGVVGFFYPWFTVQLDVNAPGFMVTGGLVDFMEISGINGVLLNPMKIGEPDLLVAVVPLPLFAIFAILTVYFIFRIVGTKTARRLGGKFAGRGVVWLLPFIAIVILTSTLFFGLLALDPGNIDPEVILRPLQGSPFGGAVDIAYMGSTAQVVWGIQFGAWLLFAAAGLMFVAAILAASQRYHFVPTVPKD